MMKNSKPSLIWRDYHLSDDCISTLRAMDKPLKMNVVTLLGYQSITQLMESMGIRTIFLSDTSLITLAFLTETRLKSLLKEAAKKLSLTMLGTISLLSIPSEYRYPVSIFDAPCYWSMTAMRTNSPTD